MRMRGEGPRGLFLGRFHFSKCLAFPVLVGFRCHVPLNKDFVDKAKKLLV